MSPSPVADVGCGAGRVSAYLTGIGLEVTGYDLSTGMVEATRQAYPELRFEVAALHALPIADAALGGLLAWYSLIHTSPADLLSAAGEFARVTAPGALLLAAFQAGSDERVERSRGYGHKVNFINYRHDPEHLLEALSAAGFDGADADAPGGRGSGADAPTPRLGVAQAVTIAVPWPDCRSSRF